MPGASPASRLREILVFVRKPATFDEQESLAQLLQFVELVAGDEHGDAAVGSPLSEHGDELEHAVRVEAHERFVENQGLRIIDQRDDQRKTLFHAERETGGLAVAVRPKSHKFKHRADWDVHRT